jgi:hypothetical protein
MYNLQVEQSADDVAALIARGAKAGYNGMVLADYKLNVLDRVPDYYFKHVARVRAVASKHKVEIIPAVCPIGYSNGLLAHDPNLAEGLPVEAAPFVVRGRDAVLDGKQAARLKNGDLEEVRGDAFVGFGFQDDPGKASFADRQTVHGGKLSCRMEETTRSRAVGNTRLIQRVKVRPHACYRFSAWVKTRDLSAPRNFHLQAIGAAGNNPGLTFAEGGVAATQDWAKYSVVFNTLDQAEINLYAGVWGVFQGTLWLDDLAIEELALVNVLRRPGCPLSVTSADGRTAYAEGRDFDPVIDPKLGQVPYAGGYSFDHDGASFRLTPGSRIKDGDQLLVNWYHPIVTVGDQVMCCLSEPKVYTLIEDQVRRVNELLRPQRFLMSHDEIRVANWCRACRDRKQSPGELLADNVRRCTAIIKKINPRADVAVWSDMFDPHHNAVGGYYLVNGTLNESWKGLVPGTLIANWNGGHARDSLRFFSDLGFRQLLAGYYDGDDLSGFTAWDHAARGVPKVEGFMYTTWVAKYGLLERYGEAMRGTR